MSKILAIDTSCDETAVAVTEGTQVLSNVVWSQASRHAEFGGVVPSVAQRAHEERIDWVLNKALRRAQCDMADISAVAVTIGPGLGIALGVGIESARELAKRYGKQLIGVNHLEGHVLSPLAAPGGKRQETDSNLIEWPAMGIVISGKHTEVYRAAKIGQYEILARTRDDALGEALDKAARMLGLGYPGGAILEKMARLGNGKAYPLPLPMAGRENENGFSYSGLKTAFWRLTNGRQLDRQMVYDLAASFQARAFEHLIRISKRVIEQHQAKDILIGGGVAANTEVRRKLRALGKEMRMRTWFPYSRSLCGDNAAMVGVAAGFKFQRGEFADPDKIDRLPRWRIDSDFDNA